MRAAKNVQLLLCCMALVCIAAAAAQTAKDQLVSQLHSASVEGNLGYAAAVQRQLLAMESRQHHSRRRLQQPGPPKANCTPAKEADGTTPAAIQPLVTCAQPQCVATNRLAVQGAAVVCRFTAPAGGTKVEEFEEVFGEFLDDEELWDTDSSKVLLGGSANTKTTTTNQLNTRVGQVGTNNDIKSTTDIAAIPNPLLGLAAGLANTLNLLTSTYGVDAASPLTFSGKDAIGFSTDGNFGAYMPGTVATAREVEDGGSDDNTALPVRSFFGKH